MSFLIALAALVFLMLVAYRGYSVILFAPVAALRRRAADRSRRGAAGLHRPVHGQDGRLRQALLPGLPARRGVRQGDRAVRASPSPSSPPSISLRRAASARCSSIVLVCALLTYGGVSLFVVVFAVYPFAAEMFRQSDIPKRLIPARSRSAPSPSRWTRCPARRRSRTSSRPRSSRPTPGPRRWLGHDRRGLHPRRRHAVPRLAPPRRPRRRAKATAPATLNEPEPFDQRAARPSVRRHPAAGRWSAS